MTELKRVTFVGPLMSTFVKNDLEILRRNYRVDAIDVNLGKGSAAAINLATLHARILRSLLKSDFLFFWFADYYTMVPTVIARLLGKRVFVVAGGFDVTYLPELGIGARTRPARWFAVKNTFLQASHIFTVSQDTQHDLDAAVPRHAPSTMIYNAVDTRVYHLKQRERKDVALTVSQADAVVEYQRKGIDRFIALGSELKEKQLRVVGLRGAALDRARADAKGQENVEIIPGRLPLNDLLEEFWTAKVYCQLSIEERFGVAVAEAMSCGCIPVVTPVRAMQEVVGEAGFVVSTPSETAGVVLHAMKNAESLRETAVQQASQFDIEHRATKLLEVVETHLRS